MLVLHRGTQDGIGLITPEVLRGRPHSHLASKERAGGGDGAGVAFRIGTLAQLLTVTFEQ